MEGTAGVIQQFSSQSYYIRLEKKGYRIYGRIKNIAGGVCL